MPHRHNFSVCLCNSQGQNQVVQVISNDASVYAATNVMEPQSFQVKKGETFVVDQFKKNWVSIRMFTGATRYIRISDVEFVYEVPSKNISDRIKMCDEIQKAQTKAAKSAFSKYPDNLSLQSTYENLLIDKYILTIFRNHDMPTIHNSIMLECISDPVIPEPVQLEF